MTILRSGTSKKYSDNWTKAFGTPKKKGTTAKSKTAKKKSTKKKSKSKKK